MRRAILAQFGAIRRNALTPFFRRLRYTLRAVGVPARQAGTPCWNSEYSGVDYRGLASENENVRLCWHGGSAARGHGGGFLNNHNWVEYYDPADGAWHFVNVPPGTKAPDAGLCGDVSRPILSTCSLNCFIPCSRSFMLHLPVLGWDCQKRLP